MIFLHEYYLNSCIERRLRTMKVLLSKLNLPSSVQGKKKKKKRIFSKGICYDIKTNKALVRDTADRLFHLGNKFTVKLSPDSLLFLLSFPCFFFFCCSPHFCLPLLPLLSSLSSPPPPSFLSFFSCLQIYNFKVA